MLNRRGDVGLGAIVVIVIILVVVADIRSEPTVIYLGMRECTSSTQCGEGSYCGSDFACHPIPTIEKTTVTNNLLVPSIIIGLAIIIATVLRNRAGNGASAKQ